MPHGDPLAQVSPGQPLEISATSWNMFAETTRNERANRQKLPGAIITSEIFPRLTVDVHNRTGQNIPQFGIMAVREPLILPSDDSDNFSEALSLKGSLPDERTAFVVALEALSYGPEDDRANGDVGRCAVMGLARVYLNVTDATHKFAKATNSINTLDSASSGPARIIWYDQTDGATGDSLDAYVLLQSWGAAACDSHKYEKTYRYCWDGDTLKQTFTIRDCCCNVILQGCESIANCGPECGSSGGIDLCPCAGSLAPIQVVTITGMSDGDCSLCSNLNGKLCLHDNGNCTYTGSRGTIHVPLLGGCAESSEYLNGELTIFPDGSAMLHLWVEFPGAGLDDASAFYYTSAFDCTGSNSWSLLKQTARCNWGTVTTAPAADDSDCTGGEDESDCTGCEDVTTFWLEIEGTTDGLCGFCSNLDANLGLTKIPAECEWQNTDTNGIVCEGDTYYPTYTLSDDGSQWILEVDVAGGGALYTHPYAGWKCDGTVNVMVRSGPSSGCVMPATANVRANV